MRLALAVFAAGTGLTLLLAVWQAGRNVQLAERRFDEVVTRTVEQVRRRLHVYEYGLRGARGAVISAGLDQIDRRGFRDYSESRDIDEEFPGARGIGVIRRVAEADESRFLAAARRDGSPDFTIRMLAPHAGDRYVIQYIEPIERNLLAIGLDVASERNRREAAESSMRTGQATLTAPITLMQASHKPQRSFLLLLPIYASAGSTSTLEERVASTVAWSFAPLLMDEVLADFNLGVEFSLTLRDAGDAPGSVFFTTPGHDLAAVNGLRRQVPLPIYGRIWRAELKATPAFVSGLNLFEPGAIGAVGSSMAALLAILSFSYAQSRRREAEVRAEQARRAAIVDSTTDAIIGETPEGVITDWNYGAELLFGYSAVTALGRTSASLLLPEGREAEDAEVRAAIARGERVPAFDTTRLHADGSLLEVSVTVALIHGPAGKRLGVSKTIRDIGAAKRSAREIAELNANLERQVLERTALLDASQRDLRNILDAVPSLVSYWDRDFRNRFANRAYREWLGLDPTQMPGKHLRELAGGAFDNALPRFEAALRGEATILETTLTTREGSLRHAVAHYLPDVVNGEVQGFYVIVYDVTAQTQARAELQQAKDRIAIAADGAGIGIWEWDVIADVLTWDEWMYRLYGQPTTNREQPYALWSTNLHPDDRERTERELHSAVAGGPPFDTEFRIFRADGEVRHLKATARVIRDESGKPLRMTGVNFDITERKRAELKLIETSSLLGSVLESSSEVAIIAVDPQMVVKVFNPGAERLLGYSADEVLNRSTPDLFHDLDEVAARAAELSVLAAEPVSGGAAFIHPLALGEPRDWTYVRKDSRRVAVSLVVTAMYGKDGEIFGYLGVAHDVTRQKQYESTLRDAILAAEQASRVKSEFLANMSHEIRTPMNAVVGLSHVLGQSALDSEQAAFVAKIHVASRSLLAIINDVLDVSKIEAGELAIENAPFRLTTVLAEVCDLVSVQAHAKQICFSADLPAGLPEAVAGDVTRLSQILNNLLSNAIKFTARGSVTLRVRESARSNATVELRFEVEDTGIGIPPGVQGRLFSPFAQADASITRRFGGTGLGLSIVKRLANLMGGTVGLSSQPDIGSTFWVTIPLQLAEHAPPLEAQAERAAANGLFGVRVLVADDSELNRFVAKHVLQQEGATVTLVNNGQDAVDYLREHAADCDVVLMDAHMPVMDGYGACEIVRGELGLATLPLIALTADARPSERQRALAVGMNEFLAKPFEPRDLVACIQKVVAAPLKRPHSAARQAATGNQVWPELPGIDNASVRQLLGDDPALFRSLLFRLLDEFADVAPPENLDDAPAIAGYAAQLHKLRGAAGQLGARTIHDLAGRIEQGFVSGRARSSVMLVKSLTLQLGQLRTSAHASFAPESLPERTSAPPPAIDPPLLLEVARLLREQNLVALRQVHAMYPWARLAWGDQRFEQFVQHVEHLRFAEAAAILEPHISAALQAAPTSHGDAEIARRAV
ncbi:MAG TPA: PAS domain S-box protein [Polyangiaceae bacterium]